MDALERLVDVVNGLFTNEPECLYIPRNTSSCTELSALGHAVTNKDAVTIVNLLRQILKTCLVISCSPEPVSVWPAYFHTCINCVSAILCAVCLITVSCRLADNVNWANFLKKLFVLLFVAGIIWNFCFAYHTSVASKMATLTKLKNVCHVNGKTLYNILLATMRTLFVVVPVVDACEKEMRALYVDALWETSPSSALTATATKFIVEPLEIAAETMNTVFRSLFADIPLTMIPFLLGFLIYGMTLSIIVCAKYTVCVPWLFEMKPVPPSYYACVGRETGRRKPVCTGIRRRCMRWK